MIVKPSALRFPTKSVNHLRVMMDLWRSNKSDKISMIIIRLVAFSFAITSLRARPNDMLASLRFSKLGIFNRFGPWEILSACGDKA